MLLTFFAAPLTEWIARAPEIGAAVQEKMRVFDYPLSVLHDIKNAIMPGAATGRPYRLSPTRPKWSARRSSPVTPAVSQFVVFFGTMIFFLITNIELRRKLIVSFGHARRTIAHDAHLERHRGESGRAMSGWSR